mgnify:CR=1 FL=1
MNRLLIFALSIAIVATTEQARANLVTNGSFELNPGTNGWTIGPVVRDFSEEVPNADEEDSKSLYSLLENTVIPLFYNRDETDVPEKWVGFIKNTIAQVAPNFTNNFGMSGSCLPLVAGVCAAETIVSLSYSETVYEGEQKSESSGNGA